ncbi:MAG: hypothetical protein J6S50_04870 [Oscillospiraceae bacterium]|nr:hypothetical protein [Oscillospiraceae bacterium]
MMYVNAFWFGFLIAIIAVVVLLMVIAFVGARRSYEEEEENEVSEEEFKEALEALTGKSFRVVRDKRGNLVGEIIEDKKDDSTD